MPDVDKAQLEVVLDLGGETQQAEIVGHGSALLADALRHLLLRQAALVDQALVTEGGLDRVEVLPLHVLHDRHLQHTLVVGVPHVGGNHIHSRHPAGPVTAFAADDLVAAACGLSDRDRLDQAQRADGIGQLFQGVRIEGGAGLERVGLDHPDRDAKDVGRRGRVRAGTHDLLVDIAYRLAEAVQVRRITQQGAEALAQASLRFRCHFSYSFRFCPGPPGRGSGSCWNRCSSRRRGRWACRGRVPR